MPPEAEAIVAADAATAAPAAVAATSLVGGQSPEAGEATAAAAAGQGAGSETAAGGASAEGAAAEAGEGGAAPGAPEQYAAFTMADGYTLEGDMLEGVQALAKAHNMTQEQAQGLVDLGAKQAQGILAKVAEEASQNPVFLKDHWAGEWSKQTAADAEIGGQHLATSAALSARVFATFGSPELGQFLENTGLAHHPELFRFMVKVGKAVSEDTLVTPQGGAQTGAREGDVFTRAGSKLYPNMN